MERTRIDQLEKITNVLLVDDDKITREITKALLEYFGCNVREALDGPQCLEEIGLGFRPSVVLTDYQMPGMDGVTLAVNILTTCPSVKVVIMSGTSPQDFKASPLRDAIMNGVVSYYLAKPFSLAELKAALDAVSEIQ